MDLLGGYGSENDGSGSDGEREAVPKQASPTRASAPGARTGLLGSMPPPKAPTSKEEDPGAPSAGGGRLWSKLPAPSGAGGAVGLGSLPPPSAAGPSAAASGPGARRVVKMALPFQKELLAAAALDSDDDDEPAAKRAKQTGGGKSKLMDFLPPPKFSVGPGAALGAGTAQPRSAGAVGRGTASAGAAAAGAGPGSAAAAAGGGGAGAPLPSDFFAGGAGAAYDNEAFRVKDDAQQPAGPAMYGAHMYPPPAGAPAHHDPYTQAYYHQQQGYAAGYGPGPSGPAGPSAGPGPSASGRRAAAGAWRTEDDEEGGGAGAPQGTPEELIAAALRAEAERAGKRGKGGARPGEVKVVEIKAKDLTHMDPAAAAAAQSTREALGSEYAMALRRSAQPFEGSKTAKRKHQIGTLLFNARMQELDMMEKRGQGQKSKAETVSAVDFALVFTSNHSVTKEAKGSLAGAVVAALQAKLPPGTPIVGCGCAGLMGVGPGGAFEMDPSDAVSGRRAPGRPAALSLLLGRMPGCRVRAFCNLPPSPAAVPAKRGARAAPSPDGLSPATQAANAAVCAWLTDRGAEGAGEGAAAAPSDAEAGSDAGSDAAAPAVSASALGVQSMWLLMGGTNPAYTAMEGLLGWLQRDEPARPVIAGGVASTTSLFFHPGRQAPPLPPGAADPPTGSANPASALAWELPARGLHYVGLAVMPGGAQAPARAAPRGEASGAGPSAAPAPASASAPAAAAPSGPDAPPPAAAVRACALALRGCGGLPDQPVFERVAVAQELLGRPRRGGGGAGAGSSDEEEEEADEDDEDGPGAVLVTVSGGVCAKGSSLMEELKAAVQATHSMPYLAVWTAPRGDPSITGGLSAEVFRSARVVLGQVDVQLVHMYGQLGFRALPSPALEALCAPAGLAGGGLTVCAQLADITPEGCRQHLRAELPVLRSVCAAYDKPLPGGRPDPRRWEGYSVVRAGALAAGARAGPVALAVFSCTGRGRAIFGEASAECEARIADEVLGRGTPFVGAFCNGELGPAVRAGYAGWAFNPLCAHPAPQPAPAPAGPVEASGGRHGSASSAAPGAGVGASGGGSGCGPGSGRCVAVSDGRLLPLDRTRMQGYTSVYAALG
ncbi:hypothetical protein HYH03_000733 [Edaphochlamys debaryana]|uniref:FIST domain-containing protein n=1 Tax=Edaphochlamys debaryana TaxID=47281 RepID=A0A835YG20_9CHLO|nr:hypothetical protein HYH03_000733 [Edaphochlamys debaryana]|eukprot:KAG2502247.1 hypothetical protein HYH03_000733 [Edaphochlamys debaryana]